MAIKFQYNKTSLQQLEKQLKVRVRTLPIIKNKESALRMEVNAVKRKLPIWRIGSNNKFKPMKPCSPFGMSLTLH